MKRTLLTFLLFLACASSAEAGYTIYKGKIVNSLDVPTTSCEKHYELACEALDICDWHEASYHLNIIVKNFPKAPFHNDCQYYLGVAYFYEEEYEFANIEFNNYIQGQSTPSFFQEAIGYKLEIANRFKDGAKRRFFGTKMLPKWAPAKVMAQEIYNEVIAALPCHDYAAQALWGKAHLHWAELEFRESVESFQLLVRRFPKHELAPAAYLCVNQVYLNQAECEFQNPDLLALAQINTRRFEKDFPKDERLCEASSDVQRIKELYAKGLFDTAQFYERIEQPEASIIYYKSAIEQFPDTSYASCSRRRLQILGAEEPVECDPSS